MTGLPTIAVRLDDGTGTFPYDVSTYLRLTDGYSIVRGRTDEFSDVQPSTLSLTLDNTDGRFSLGSTIINATSPIYLNNRIQVLNSFSTNPTFTADVNGWAPTNCTLSWSSSGYSNPGSMQMVASTAANMSAATASGTSGFAVTAGAPYLLSGRFRTEVTSRSVTITVSWYNSGGGLISSSTTPAVSDNTTSWTEAAATVTAPSTAAFAAVQANVASPASGEAHFVDSIGLWLPRFTGYVQMWPVAWPDGSDQFAVAQITATDALARMSRRPLRSIIEEEVLQDTSLSGLYYTLGEASGATSAGDTSFNGDTFLPLAGTGTAVVFGSATGPSTDGLTAAQFANGQYLAGSATPLGTTVGLRCSFSTSTTPSGAATMIGVGLFAGSPARITLGINNSGKLTFIDNNAGLALTGATTVTDGATHDALVTISGGTATLYLDGASQGTLGGVSGAAANYVVIGQGYTGVLAHAAAFGANVTATRALAQANAVLNGFNTESSDQRITRYLGYGGISATNIVAETGVQTNVPHYQIDGQSITSAAAKVNEAENGLVFVRGDGKWQIQNRQHRQLKVTADWSLTAIDIDPGTAVPADMQKVVNTATSSRTNGAKQSTQNSASVTTHGQYAVSYDGLLVTTDQQALDRINWQVGTHAQPSPRFNQMQVDLLSASLALQQAAQTRELSDRIGISGLPSQAPSGLADQIIEGWTETLTATSWDMTFNTSPWSLEQAWILGDSTYGVLGSTTRLGF